MKKRDLTKKVLCTVLAASVFGICGNVSAAEEADKFENNTFTLASDETYIKPDTNVHIENATMTVDGKYEVDNVGIVGKNTITVNGTGTVWGGIDMSVREGEEAKGAPTLTAKNAIIYSWVQIGAGTATLNGGELIAGKAAEIEEKPGNFLQEDIRVNGQDGVSGVHSSLTLNNVKVTGDIMAEYDGAVLEINGGSVQEVEYYDVVGDHTEDRHIAVDGEGNFITDGYTEVHAEKGGKVTVTDAVLNTGVTAFGKESVVTVNNSSIKTQGSIFAGVGGKIYLNGNENTVYSLGGEDVFMAFSGSEDGESGDGLIEINGGTLKAENLRYLVGKDNSNPWLSELENDKMSIVEGGIVLQKNGVIETKGDQIFENGAYVSSSDTLNSDSGDVTNTAISYVGGTLKLTDEKYRLDYVKTAKAALSALTYNSVASTTGIVMTGTLVNENGEENTATAEEISSVGDEIVLDKVTATSENNLIVGVNNVPVDTVEGIKVENAVDNGFSVAALDIAGKEGVTTNGLVITDGENVTLGGSKGGELITVNGNKVENAENLKVVVGTNSSVDGAATAGTLTIGNELATSNTQYTLSGSVTVNEGSALNVNGQTTVANGVTLNNSAVDVGNGTLASDIKVTGTSANITGAVQVGTLEGVSGAVINIGNTDKAGNVTVANADLQGATVFLDPTWVDGAEITDASKMAVAGTDGKVNLNGNYVVGQNSVMSFGVDNNEKAQETFAKTGLTWDVDAVTAGLYINGSVDLTNGAVVVDGDMETAPTNTINNGTFTAAANSVVMVDGQSIKENAAITGVVSDKVTVADTSKLFIDGAENGAIYHVINGTDKGWENVNIIADNALLTFTGDTDSDGKYDVIAASQNVNDVYGEGAVAIAGIVDKTLATKDEGDKAFDFFNDAVNYHNNTTKAAQVAALNSVANMGELAGINHGTYSMSNAMTDAVAHHLSLATHGEQDKDIWAHYIHNKEDIDGMDLGGIEGSYDAQYNGIVVGSDLYKNGKVTAGVALSYADGNIDGSNIAATTKNDAEYYGASLYGRIDNGNSAILGDISYLHSDNDITQNNSGQEITASADADAFSIGIRAEQAYEAGAGKFVPYAGIRYMHLGAGNYDNSLGMSYDADDQNLWLLPVGVTYSAEVQSGDWTVKPVAEVGYVWTMGDRDTDMTVSLNGAADCFGFETADSGSFIGRLGIEAEKSNVTYGLGYEYQKGDTVKANKWMANLTFSF